MAGVTNELIYEALLKIDEDIADLRVSFRELVTLARDTNAALAAGQQRIEQARSASQPQWEN